MGKLSLVVNPGSTSAKLALFEDEACLVSDALPHDLHAVAGCPRRRISAPCGWRSCEPGSEKQPKRYREVVEALDAGRRALRRGSR